MVRRGVVKEGLLQMVSVTIQVAISRRVSRFKLQLRNHQEVRRNRGGTDNRPTPISVGIELGYGLGFLRLRSKNT